MFDRLKLKLAKLHDAKVIHRLFLAIDRKIRRRDIVDLIKEREVMVLKRRKKIRAAFAYTIFGILGLFGIMYIRKLAVHPAERGRGLGSHLLSRIKWLASRMGLFGFFLFSLEKAKKFYAKNRLNGFGRLFWWRKG